MIVLPDQIIIFYQGGSTQSMNISLKHFLKLYNVKRLLEYTKTPITII